MSAVNKQEETGDGADNVIPLDTWRRAKEAPGLGSAATGAAQGTDASRESFPETDPNVDRILQYQHTLWDSLQPNDDLQECNKKNASLQFDPDKNILWLTLFPKPGEGENQMTIYRFGPRDTRASQECIDASLRYETFKTVVKDDRVVEKDRVSHSELVQALNDYFGSNPSPDNAA